MCLFIETEARIVTSQQEVQVWVHRFPPTAQGHAVNLTGVTEGV